MKLRWKACNFARSTNLAKQLIEGYLIARLNNNKKQETSDRREKSDNKQTVYVYLFDLCQYRQP